MKTIILGVGNPILKDDGVGIHVVKALKHHIQGKNITMEEAFTGGMPLVEKMAGYEKAIIIDAVKTKKCKVGEVMRLSLDDFATVHSFNPHDVSLSEALKVANEIGIDVPKEIVIIGIAVNKAFSFGEELSAKIAKAVPLAVEMVLKEVKTNDCRK